MDLNVVVGHCVYQIGLSTQLECSGIVHQLFVRLQTLRTSLNQERIIAKHNNLNQILLQVGC